MKHTSKQWTAAATSAALTLSCVTSAFAAAPAVPISDGRTPTVDEAYYATLDYYGNLTEGSVVKSYVLNGATSITDYGEYESVTNLTDSTVATEGAKQVAFDFAGASTTPTHFYFQGTTAQPYQNLPWTLTLSYKLNGVPTKAEDLAGKTGVVEINIDAIPNNNVSDYVHHNYTLEAMAIFNQDDILSLEAPGAQVQLLGNLRAVLFVAFPGEEGHYSIRVGADKFAFDGMTFLMVPATLSQLDEISKLAQRKEDLEDNYEKLSGSLDALLDSLDAVSGSLYSSANGLDALNAARGTISAGKADVYAAADKALSDLDAMSESLKPLSGDLGAASDTLKSANQILGDMTDSTVALRGDLETLDKTLKNAQGDKKDALAAIDDIERLQGKLKNASSSLGSLGVTRLSPVSSPLAGQSTKELSSSLDSILALEQLQNDVKSSSVDEKTFIQKILTTKGDSNAAANAASLKAIIDMGASSAEDAYTKVAQQVYSSDPAFAAMGLSMPTDYASAQNFFATLEAASASDPALATAAAYKAKAEGAYANYSNAQQLHQLYGVAKSGDFEAFLTAALGSKAADAIKLYNLYQADADAAKAMIAEAGDINDTVNDINSSISDVNRAISSVGSASDDASALLLALSDAAANAGSLRSVVENVDDLTELAQKDSAVLQSTLDSLAKLQSVLDAYQPQLDNTSRQVQAASETLSAASVDTNTFLRSAETLLQAGGTQFDDATYKSLSSLASALRGTASALGQNGGVRDAKETINSVVEDVWDDYTGDVSDLLEMDATAEAVSLTDPRNPAPASVQVLIRTQEIKEPTVETLAVKAGAAAAPKTTFWDRVAAMFAGMWSAVVGIFHR